MKAIPILQILRTVTLFQIMLLFSALNEEMSNTCAIREPLNKEQMSHADDVKAVTKKHVARSSLK